MIIFECLTQCDLLLQGSKSLSETARIEKHQSELLKEKKNNNHRRASCFIRSCMTSRPQRLKKTSSMQLKCHDLHHT